MKCRNGCGEMADAGSETRDGTLVTCMICGHGEMDRSRILCPSCEGDRFVRQPAFGQHRCSTCNGAGFVPAPAPKE